MPVELQSHNAVAVLAFPGDDPFPRLTERALVEIEKFLAEFRREGIFRGVVIAANDRSFATGADVQTIATLQGFRARQFAERGQRLFAEIALFPAPVVAAIRGYCLGGGLDLALACHARVAAYDASFGHPGGALGLITGWAGTQRLPQCVGKAAAMQMLLTGERVPATQALTMGLVDELVPSSELIEGAASLAERIAEHGQTALWKET